MCTRWPLYSVIVALLFCTACRAAPSALAPSSTMLAETPTGAMPMLRLGQIQRSGDSLTIAFDRGRTNEASWVDLLRAPRILAVLVNLPEKSAREMRVWLWRGSSPIQPNEWLDITGDMTRLDDGRGYRIAFRDISGEAIVQAWARGDGNGPPAVVTVHRHDNGFALASASPPARTTPFGVGVGVPGSTIYAIRLER